MLLSVAIDVDLDVIETGAAPGPDVFEGEPMRAGASEPDGHYPRGVFPVGMIGGCTALVHDLGGGSGFDQLPEIAGGSVILDVNCKEVVRAGLEKRTSVRSGQFPHVCPGVRNQLCRSQGVFPLFDGLFPKSAGLRPGENTRVDQTPTRGLVADAKAKRELVDVVGLTELLFRPPVASRRLQDELLRDEQLRSEGVRCRLLDRS